MIEIQVRKRFCGWPVEGGLYLVTDGGSREGVLAPVVLIDPPVPTQRKPHRGPLLVRGQHILDRLPEDKWVVGSSAKTVERNRADQVWEDLFGMPLRERLGMGACAEHKTADEAYAYLLDQVTFSKLVLKYMRDMAIDDIQNLPHVAPVYASMVRSLQEFVRSKGEARQELVRIAGLTWRLYNEVHHRHRSKLTMLPYMLAALGLPADGREMALKMKLV
jgi:hypothetical protein